MDGKRESIKMDPNTMIAELWKEIVQKETIKTLITMVNNINEERIREIIREELAKLYEEPQQVLEKDDKGKQIIEEADHQPQMVAINAWRRTSEPIVVDISKSKPEISDQVNKTLDGLGELYRKRKF